MTVKVFNWSWFWWASTQGSWGDGIVPNTMPPRLGVDCWWRIALTTRFYPPILNFGFSRHYSFPPRKQKSPSPKSNCPKKLFLEKREGQQRDKCLWVTYIEIIASSILKRSFQKTKNKYIKTKKPKKKKVA